MNSIDEDPRDFVKGNRPLISDVLRYSQDPYARAWALVLLKHGGTERDVRAIEEDLDEIRDELRA